MGTKELDDVYEYIKKTYYNGGEEGREIFFSNRAKEDSIKYTQLLLTSDKKLKKLAYKLLSSKSFYEASDCIMRDGFFCTCYKIFNVKVFDRPFPCSGCDKKNRAMLSREIERRMKPRQTEFDF